MKERKSIMSKKKKYVRTLNEVGNRKYDFDYIKEKQIYFYLCRLRQKRKNEKELEEQYRFGSYREWKMYIQNKYSRFDREELMEFSRYLNQRIRNTKPAQEYIKLVIPAIISWVITEFFRLILQDGKLAKFESIHEAIIYFAIILLIGVGSVSVTFIKMSNDIWDQNMEENLCVDYKEIIDEMIEKHALHTECNKNKYEK